MLSVDGRWIVMDHGEIGVARNMLLAVIVKYVTAFRTVRSVVLDEGVNAESVATDCREAAVALMAGADWTKRELATWLEGPYARATRYSRPGERTFAASVEPRALEPLAIERLLAATRADMLKMLAESLEPNAFEFAHDAVARGMVRRASDEHLESVWLPVDAVRMHLRDRVCALFAAHRLNDPATHAALFICPECESVVFDERAREVGRCGGHRQRSGFEIKSGALDAGLAVGGHEWNLVRRPWRSG